MNQSLLAEKLSLDDEPSKPQKFEYGINPGIWIGIVFVILYVIGWFLLIDDLIRSTFCYSPIIAGVGTWLIWLLLDTINHTNGKFRKACEDYELDLIFYNLAKKEWDELYYCFKHDIAFSLSRREPIPADKVIDTLYDWVNENGIK